jgi:hypothetical protein
MSMCQKLVASILFLLCGISLVVAQGSYTAQIRLAPSRINLVPCYRALRHDYERCNRHQCRRAQQPRRSVYPHGPSSSDYTLKAEAAGFRGVERKDVVLAVSRDTTVDLSMNPLSVTETVIVTGAPPLLDTESAAIGTGRDQ